MTQTKKAKTTCEHNPQKVLVGVINKICPVLSVFETGIVSSF